MKVIPLLIVSAISILTLASCSQQASPSLVAVGTPGKTDFFSVMVNSLSEEDSAWERPTDCRANIAKVLCEVIPLQNDNEWYKLLDRKCLGNESQYLPAIEKIYDGLDSLNQGMFCSLRRIFIEQELDSTAYASVITKFDNEQGEQTLPGAVMGIRKSLLTNTIPMATWMTWKEQLNFTEVNRELETPLAYPKFEIQGNLSFLQNVFGHEFGHLFDFANKINKINVDGSCLEKVEEENRASCYSFADDSWASLSWKSVREIKPEHDFFGRKRFCYYYCQPEDRMNESEMNRSYKEISLSDFVSTYAATNAYDDFAESWNTYWVIQRGSNVLLHVNPDFRFSSKEIYQSDKFRSKREFIANFLKSKIAYP